jgi:nitrogen-specific signal transduction histidine kinase
MMNDLELKNHLQRLERKLLVIYGIGLLVLTTLALVSNYLMKDQAAKQATSMIKRAIARDFREVVYTLNDAELDHFKAVVYFNQDSERLFSLPAELDLQLINQPSFFTSLINSRIETNLYFDPQEKNKIGSVIYIFNRFSHVPWALGIWLFFLLGTIPLVRDSRRRLLADYHRDIKLREETTRADLARRVRHDIRSPLGALQIAIQDLAKLPARQGSIIKKATDRINEIVAELELIRIVPDKCLSAQGKSRQPILSLTQDIIQEKRTRLKSASQISIEPQFSDDAFFLFSDFNASEFKRALSNIIENSIEACNGRGKIQVKISANTEMVTIEVRDSGKGIPPNILKHVTEKGFSHGKPDGSGLGLFYARKTIEESGGQLKIESTEHQGALAQVLLPRLAPPMWYTNGVTLPNGGTVVILDDQESFRLSLRSRLDEFKKNGIEFAVESFERPADLIKWYEVHRSNVGLQNTVYFFDYDLGKGEQNGLEVAAALKLRANTFLMTGHYDLEDIQRRCILQNLKLVPKSQIPSLELRVN